jgi:5-methylcytosine-specific restriction endonuclease McrA
MVRGDLVAATITHHTVPNDMEHAFDESKLEALCQSCHSTEHAQESREVKDQRRARNDDEEKHKLMYA